MCILYFLSKGQAAIRELASVWTDRTGISTKPEACRTKFAAPLDEAGGLQRRR